LGPAPRVLAALLVGAAVLAGLLGRQAAYGQRTQGAGLSLVGHTGGRIAAVVADERTAWVGEGIGITRLDIARPALAVPTDHLVLGPGEEVRSLALAQRTLFAGTTRGVHVVDVSENGGPVAVGFLPTPGSVEAITVRPDATGAAAMLFLADSAVGTLLVSVHTDNRLSADWLVPLGSAGPAATALTGDLALVPGTGLHIVSLADPAGPVEVGRVPLGGAVRGVAADGDWAFVSDAGDGLTVLSLVIPTDPEVRALVAGAPAGRLSLQDHHLMILHPTGLALFDVRQPAAPLPLAVTMAGSLAGTLDVAVLGSRLLAARGDRLTVLQRQAVTEYTPLVEYDSAFPIADVDVGAGQVFVARGGEGLRVFDFAQPTRLRPVLVDDGVGVYGAQVHDQALYLATDAGFQVREVAQAAWARWRFGEDWVPTAALSVGDRLLAASSPEWLQVAELKPGAAPVAAARVAYRDLAGWPSGAGARDIAVAEDLAAYVAVGEAGVAVIGLIDPRRPGLWEVQPLPEGQAALSVAVQAPLLAVGTPAGVLLYDIAGTRVFQPELLGQLRAPLGVTDLEFSGERLYLAAGVDGVVVLDVSRPREPVLQATVPAIGAIDRVRVAGDLVLAGGDHGLLVLEPGGTIALTPAAPEEPTPTVPAAVPGPRATPTRAPEPTAEAGRAGRAYLPWLLQARAPTN
jgi:hypothetical protein